MESNWDKDLSREDKVAVFMDKYFYSKLKSEGKIKDYSRIIYSESDYKNGMNDEQKEGIDWKVETEGGEVKIDDKAALDYVNKDLKTFAFEIDYKMGEKINKGWFIDETKKTDVYALMYLSVEPGDEGKIDSSSPEIFTSVLTLFVRRDKVDKYLNSLGYTKDFLTEKANDLREKYNEGLIDKAVDDTLDTMYHQLRLIISTQKKEEPALLLISKNRLRELADKIVTVTKDGYTIEPW